jgi:hypothetical protein
MKYDEHDIKKLDFIIDCVLETDLPIYSNCFDKSELTLGETKDDKEFEFERLLDLIRHFGIANINTDDYWYVERNRFTKRHKIDGGFYPIFKNLNDEAKQKQKQIKKENTEYTLTKWKYYTFWPLFIIALFGGGYSIYDFKERLTTKANSQQVQSTKEQTELEQSKSHISTLNQKNQDSSFQTSSEKETSTQKIN